MKSRCHNPNYSRYAEWGGRGITVCERWRNSFENFLSDMGEVPSPYHTLDRWPNPDGNYEPSNCRWATRSKQQRNRRDSRMLTFKERTQNMYDWADELGLPVYIIRNRLDWGWPVDRVLSTPVKVEYGRQGRPITYNGETKSISQWANTIGISFRALWGRIDAGWPIEEALGYVKHQRKHRR